MGIICAWIMDVLRLNQEKVFDPKVLNCKLYEGEYSKECISRFNC